MRLWSFPVVHFRPIFSTLDFRQIGDGVPGRHVSIWRRIRPASAGAKVIKLFTAVYYESQSCLVGSAYLVFVLGRRLQPSLMFVGKAGAYPIEVPFRRSTLGQAPGLAHKQLHRLERLAMDKPGNTKGGSITVPLTSCLTGLDQSVLQIKTKIVCSHTADSKPVKQEVNGTMILPPLVFPGQTLQLITKICKLRM